VRFSAISNKCPRENPWILLVDRNAADSQMEALLVNNFRCGMKLLQFADLLTTLDI